MAMSFQLRRAVHAFHNKRGEFYLDLSQSMDAQKGVPIIKILEKYAARYENEPTGVICSYWLEQYPHKGRFSEVVQGTIPEQDAAMLSTAEEAGDLLRGLQQLGTNVINLTSLKKDVWSSMGAALLMFVILHVFVGIEAFVVVPKLQAAMQGVVSLSSLGKFSQSFFYASNFIKDWWVVWAVFMFSVVWWIFWALPNYTGKFRTWLDDHFLPFQMYREFSGASFMIGLGDLSMLSGTKIIQINEALTIYRGKSSIKWLNWHIDKIQKNLQLSPNSKAEIFNTGITNKKIYYRLLDIAEYSELSVMLQKVGEVIMKIAPEEIKKRAVSLRFLIMITAILLMLLIYGGTGNIIEEFKAAVLLKSM